MTHVYNEIPASRITPVARKFNPAEDRERNRFQLSAWFPAEFLDDMDYKYDIGTDRDYNDSAEFRAWDTTPSLGTRPGWKSESGELPVLSKEYLVTEFDQVKLRAAQRNQSFVDLLLPVIGKDVLRGRRAIERRFEFVRRDLLIDGEAQLRENGVQLDITTGRAASKSATAAVDWGTSATAECIEDERDMVDLQLDEEDMTPDQMVEMMNTVTYRKWRDSVQVREFFDTVRVVPEGALNRERVNQIRRDAELPAIVINDSRGINPDTGLVEKIIPDDKVLFLPDPDGEIESIGQTFYGVTPMALDPDVDIPLNEQPGALAYVARSIKPSNYSTVIEALGVSVLKDPGATAVLDTTP